MINNFTLASHVTIPSKVNLKVYLVFCGKRKCICDPWFVGAIAFIIEVQIRLHLCNCPVCIILIPIVYFSGLLRLCIAKMTFVSSFKTMHSSLNNLWCTNNSISIGMMRLSIEPCNCMS